jgi:hypothetical protein
LWEKVDFFDNMVYNLLNMSEYIVNKKSPQIILIILLFFGLFYFFYFKSTEAQVCTGYLVWPGTWEPGRMPMASNQQYVLTGSPIYVSGSNVGIGTRSPVYTFQVNGDISGTRLCIGSDCRSVWPEGGGGGGGITGSGVSGQVTFWTGSTSVGGDNNLFWNNLNKRLGIGTTTPQTSLHVVGNITANSFLGTINAANISSGQFGANTGGGNYSFPGNVGIGTTAPAYKLDIAGALRLQPSSAPIGANGVIYYDSTANKFKCFENGAWVDCISAGGGGFWAASGANIYNTNTGNVGIGTTAPGYKLDIVGALRLQPSSAPIGANGVIYYDATANKFKCFENGAWKDCIGAGGIGGSGTTNYLAKWTGSTTLGNSIIYDNGTNVGIGTTTPSERLEINGNLLINPPGGTTGYIIGKNQTSSATSSIVLYEAGTGNMILQTNYSSAAIKFRTAGANDRVIIDSSGKVGIGTTAPQTYLDVIGSNAGTRSLLLRSGDTSGAPADSMQIIFGYNGGLSYPHNIRTRHNSGAATGNAIDFYIWNYGVDAVSTPGTKHVMTLEGTGNVGIGTTAPGYKLDIVGALRLQPSSAPIGANGVIYYDSTANKFKCFENGAWVDCISAGGIPSGAYIAFPDSNPRPGFTYTGVIEVVRTGTTQLNLYWFQKQ